MDLMTKRAHVTFWILQGVLAALFLFAGGTKLVMSLATLQAMAPLPAAFLKVIGVLEVAGALGLVLPGALHVREGSDGVRGGGAGAADGRRGGGHGRDPGRRAGGVPLRRRGPGGGRRSRSRALRPERRRRAPVPPGSFGAILPELATHVRVITIEAQTHGHPRDIDRATSFEQLLAE